jgi:NAD(P)-dependent dehydrogenase (short-subunit alcohol dehydrogenase family)
MPRTYVITGAASGIGAATTTALDELGHRTITVDRRAAEISADLATADGRAQLVEEVRAVSDGAVDAVIACAGTAGGGVTDVAVNYFGAVATLEGLRPFLAAGTDPRAVAVASFALLEDVDGEIVAACLRGDEATALERVDQIDAADQVRIYASSKRALARWVRRRAPTSDWAGAGIAINAIAPGVVRTSMTESALADPGLADALLATVPMPFGGVMPPEDVAHVLVTLTDPALRSVTGQVIFTDGGADCVRRGDDIWS